MSETKTDLETGRHKLNSEIDFIATNFAQASRQLKFDFKPQVVGNGFPGEGDAFRIA
jgi:hypothetical protein